jgi:hypothetical protein
LRVIGEKDRNELDDRTLILAPRKATAQIHPQPHQARPSVQFVPAPYGREPASWAPRSGR